jgi:Cytochrome c554 and c-prime
MMRVRGIALVFAAIFFSAVADAQNQTVTGVSVADAGCGKCHAQILRSYMGTPMANASGLAEDRPKTGTLHHKPSGVDYTLSLEGKQLLLTYQDSKNPEVAAKRRLQYFLGSGHLGLTYLYTLNDYLFESPIAFYSASQSAAEGLDMKPGLGAITQAPPALPVLAACIACHMSAVAPSDAGTTNRYSGLPFLHTGITCESCHGDTRQHVAANGHGAVVNPSRLDAVRRDSVCIRCHLEGDVSVQRAGHSALDFKPGDSISDYVSYFVYGEKGVTHRGVSEVEQLSLSVCKRTSGDRMSCMSCHDPHFTPEESERVTFYRNKCLACHSDSTFAKAHHPEKPDCTSCHMARAGAENIPHVAWTDHRILRYPETSTADTATRPEETLVPVFSPLANRRDTGLAYFNAMLDGNAPLQPKAYQQLQAIKPELSGDAEALNALGILYEEGGAYAQAQQVFRDVLKLDPRNLFAISNLGTLLAKGGDLRQAIDLWRPAFERNQDAIGLAKNLALTQCMAGDGAAAHATLATALIYSPGLADVRQLQSRLQDCEVQGLVLEKK